jgi:mono/diheme cytochrome c family protein
MMGWHSGWLVLGCLLLIGCTGAGPAASPTVLAPAQPAAASSAERANLARGAQAFTVWCNSCHPDGGAGNGPALWGDGQRVSAEAIRRQVRQSSPREVARFTSLSDERLDDIIAYVVARGAEDERPAAPRASGPLAADRRSER